MQQTKISIVMQFLRLVSSFYHSFPTQHLTLFHWTLVYEMPLRTILSNNIIRYFAGAIIGGIIGVLILVVVIVIIIVLIVRQQQNNE